MIELTLLDYQEHLSFKNVQNRSYIWGSIRKKWLRSTPEELVRQLVISYLIKEKHYRSRLIQVEKTIKVNTLQRRYDILVFDRQIQPYLLIECKAPSIDVNQNVFDQVAQYNMAIQVPYLMVTNGTHTYCCFMNYLEKSYQYIHEIPDFESVQ
jgi:hypothetical protein